MNKKVEVFSRVLERTGYDVIEEDRNGFIVATDDDGNIAFIELQVKDVCEDIDEDLVIEHSRHDFEHAAFMYMKEHDDVTDCQVMFNVAQLFVVDKNRALFRHVVNWPASDLITCNWSIMCSKESE